MKFSNKIYDILKWFALIFFDAIGIFYSTLAEIWNLPCGREVLATCCAVSALLGTLLQISNSNSKKDNE